MKRIIFFWLWTCILACAQPAAPVNQYNVTWDSPSVNHHGSMPLGNGDVAVNAWATDSGDLHFYISKSDAWDDNARLVKMGKVRLRFTPNPFAPGQSFRQTLNLSDATLRIESAAGANRFRLQLWVDANQPVIHCTTDSSTPVAATAFVELWRTNQQELAELQTSDVLMNRKNPDKKQAPMLLEPDTLLQDQRGRIGWYHHNRKSVGPQMLAQVQGLTEFKQPDPLLHRTFGAVLTAASGDRLKDRQWLSPAATAHQFNVFVLTRHPATADSWLADMTATMRQVERKSFASRRAAHEQWWGEFWNRSWIRASLRPDAKPASSSLIPTNRHPIRLGMDQTGGNRFSGELGRISLFSTPLDANGIAALAKAGQDNQSPLRASLLFTGSTLTNQILADSAAWNLAAGFTIEAWIKPQKFGGGGARLVDKVTPGVNNGFLLDTYPGNGLRLICGETLLHMKEATPPGQWTHVAAVADPAAGGCRLYLNGKLAATDAGAAARDEAAYVSQMYHLQRFITACAGRGAYPIKFNGTLFTVPPGPTEADPDFRRWGPGYWWQNTRLPYISLCASGDFDLQGPLFKMYAQDLLPLCKFRTRKYLGHEGAFYPECIMFWGAIFSETYGWTPFEQRKDKLQESGWHKWEWVSGPELAWMMLDYYDHTGDRAFLQQTALPFSREILTFFDQHYLTNSHGKLVMHPSQAVETWWRCTNAMPELAGCIAVTDRLRALAPALLNAADRRFLEQFRAKLPAIPLREVNGKKALAPAEFFADKRNIENPELYAVFPFRLFAFDRPNPEWALAALEHRWDRGHSGWRQDDIFMAYLGLAADARKCLVSRARSHDRGERFPAFWGPNYDWTPDQDHGGVLMKAFQAMLMQTDGDRIHLLPAWPQDWDVEFKLHAPKQTVIEGAYRNGKMAALKTIPASRRADLVLPKQ